MDLYVKSQPCLRVGVTPYYPYAYPCVFDKKNPCQETGKGGVNIDRVNTLVGQILGFTCISYVSSVHSRDHNSSRRTPQELQGLIGMLVRNEIDVAGSVLDIDEGSLSLVDYSLPVTSTIYGIAQNSLGTSQPKIESLPPLFQPFSPFLWKMLLPIAGIFTVLNAFLLYRKHHGRASIRTQKVLNLSLALAAFFMFRAYKTKLYVGRVVETYRGLRFHSMKHLSDAMYAGHARFVMLKRFERIFEGSATDGGLLGPMIKMYKEKPDTVVFAATMPDMWRKISESTLTGPTYATLISESTFSTTASSFCNLAFVPLQEFGILAFAFQKHSRLSHLFNWALYNKAYSGADFNDEFTKAYASKEKCLADIRIGGTSGVHDKQSMTIAEFHAALYVYACIPVASAVACTFEILLHHISA